MELSHLQGPAHLLQQVSPPFSYCVGRSPSPSAGPFPARVLSRLPWWGALLHCRWVDAQLVTKCVQAAITVQSFWVCRKPHLNGAMRTNFQESA